MQPLPNGPVKIVVGAVIGAGLTAALYFILPTSWFIFCMVLLVVETWSFFNPYKNDTISEVVWALSERPLVPLLFGAGVAWSIDSGFITVSEEGLWITLFLGVVLGHFFWQRAGDNETPPTTVGGPNEKP